MELLLHSYEVLLTKIVNFMEIKEILYNIRKERELKSYTQDYMAAQLDITTKSYSNIETGNCQLTVERLITIAEILELPVEKLFNTHQTFSFSNCTQSGYLNHPKFENAGFEEAKIAWLQVIDLLKKENESLKNKIE